MQRGVLERTVDAAEQVSRDLRETTDSTEDNRDEDRDRHALDCAPAMGQMSACSFKTEFTREGAPIASNVAMTQACWSWTSARRLANFLARQTPATRKSSPKTSASACAQSTELCVRKRAKVMSDRSAHDGGSITLTHEPCCSLSAPASAQRQRVKRQRDLAQRGAPVHARLGAYAGGGGSSIATLCSRGDSSLSFAIRTRAQLPVEALR